MYDVREIDWKTYGVTELNLWAVLLTILLMVMILSCRRRQSVMPFLVVTHLIAFQVRLVIGDLDFTALRLVILAGLVRMAMRGELRTLPKRNNLDKAFLAWLAFGAVFHTILEGDVTTATYRIGFCLDGVGAYLIARNAIRSLPDLERALKYCSPLLVLSTVGMAIEWNTGWNVFSVLGADETTWVKDGKIRPAAAFDHPILAGSYAASMAAIYFGLIMMAPKRALVPTVGLLASIAMVLLSASSGPVASFAVALACWFLWPFRRKLRQIQIAVVSVVVVIHFVREKPVWHLIGRLSEFVGGTGYHRVRLIDAAVDHFPQWFLFGTKDTMYWGYGLQDITNFYLLQGVTGGVWTVLAMLATIAYSFFAIGKQMAANTRVPRGPARKLALGHQYFLWGLGAALATHCVSFISVAYFGQTRVILFAFFGSLAFLADPLRREARSTPSEPAPDVEILLRSGLPAPEPALQGASITTSTLLTGPTKRPD